MSRASSRASVSTTTASSSSYHAETVDETFVATSTALSASAQKTRREREQEREDLKDLNSRLQQVIVMQREKDAVLVHEREYAREEGEALSIRLRREAEMHRAAAEQTSLELQQVHSQLAKHREGESTANQRLEQALRELEQLRARTVDLDLCQAELKAANAELLVRHQEIKTLNQQATEMSVKLTRAQRSTTQAQSECDALKAEAAAREASFDVQLTEVRTQAEQLQQDLEEARAEISVVKKQMMEREKHHQRQLASNLSIALGEQTKQHEALQEQALMRARTSYEARVTELQHIAETAQSERVRIESRSADAESMIVELRRTDEQLRRQIGELQRANDDLKAEISRLQSQPKAEAQRAQRVITSMKEAYRRKETEFEMLLDVKISLAQDIKTLRDMLAAEERRLGIAVQETSGSSSSTTTTTASTAYSMSSTSSVSAHMSQSVSQSGRKKRKADSGGAAVDLFGSKRGDTAPIIISQIDLEGYYVRLRNTSTDSISLAGWSLSNENQTFKYEFGDDQQLASGESLTLWCGTPAEYEYLQGIMQSEKKEGMSPQLRRALAAKADAPADLVWGVENARLFDRGGDALSLWAPNEQCVDAKAVIPSGASVLAETKEAETKVAKKGCLIM